MTVGHAGEDRDHFLVALQRVDVDRIAVAVGARREAGGTNKLLDTRLGEPNGGAEPGPSTV